MVQACQNFLTIITHARPRHLLRISLRQFTNWRNHRCRVISVVTGACPAIASLGTHGQPSLIVGMLDRLAQNISPAPDRLDMAFATRRGCELFAQFANEDINDLQLWLIHPAIKVIQKHLFGQGVPFRRLRSSRIWYSFPVRLTGLPFTSTDLSSRLTTMSPVLITEWLCPFDLRMMA